MGTESKINLGLDLFLYAADVDFGLYNRNTTGDKRVRKWRRERWVLGGFLGRYQKWYRRHVATPVTILGVRRGRYTPVASSLPALGDAAKAKPSNYID